MIITREVFIAIGISVLVISLLAMMMKLMLMALVVDDWFELRNDPKESPARMVAEDELWTSVGRVISIILVVIIGVAWVVVALVQTPTILRITPLTFIIAGTAIGHAVLAVVNGTRSLLFRRKMARILSGHRRPSVLQEHQHEFMHDADHELARHP